MSIEIRGSGFSCGDGYSVASEILEIPLEQRYENHWKIVIVRVLFFISEEITL